MLADNLVEGLELPAEEGQKIVGEGELASDQPEENKE